MGWGLELRMEVLRSGDGACIERGGKDETERNVACCRSRVVT